MQSDNKNEIDELMNDSDKEFITPEKHKLTDNPNNVSVLKPEANVHVVDKGTTHTKEIETNKKRNKPEENTSITWKCNVFPHSQENCLFDSGVSCQFDKSASAFHVYEQVINLVVLIGLLVQQSNLYLEQNRRNFLSNGKEMKAFVGVNYILAVNKLPSIATY